MAEPVEGLAACLQASRGHDTAVAGRDVTAAEAAGCCGDTAQRRACAVLRGEDWTGHHAASGLFGDGDDQVESAAGAVAASTAGSADSRRLAGAKRPQ